MSNTNLSQYVTQCQNFENAQAQFAILDYKAQLYAPQKTPGNYTIFCSAYGCCQKHARGNNLRLWVFPQKNAHLPKNVRYYFCTEHYNQRYQLSEEDTKQYKIVGLILDSQRKTKTLTESGCEKSVGKFQPALKPLRVNK